MIYNTIDKESISVLETGKAFSDGLFHAIFYDGGVLQIAEKNKYIKVDDIENVSQILENFGGRFIEQRTKNFVSWRITSVFTAFIALDFYETRDKRSNIVGRPAGLSNKQGSIPCEPSPL
ncbi:hypothetical protein CONCODRAFT_11380 [Conidiobolus coronatus NRRL 28638]|uniref:Uncharacterized protein n=1 Tax=Conidiobolus coronatus (strain ATCC 28846 / CBS 209.66 / NRRL 28638) TaxID=796925 RepID=A0A137NVN6_CONC2|nr:hypothetical protein CONCODRAFT_11380 [Conidiobolus coronatus NRRL 28638]|eukprot:KXN66729.1 hypothetical protein CONCODRAFT_11380 [Conidiobolus coronatus NRRL 28638]